MQRRRRRFVEIWLICTAVLLMVCQNVFADQVGDVSASLDRIPYPVNEKLTYAVVWMGIHCGEMEILSYTESEPGGPTIYRIVVLMRTTRFFDGIYRVRSRLDSFLDPTLMSSVRYEERSLEKKKRKEDVWVVDIESGEVVRTKNGEVTKIPIEVDSAFDPLAFIFRLRMMDTAVGEEQVLGLMTSKGAMETVVKAKEHKTIRTKMGKCNAVAMVPQPRDDMMFSKSGSMVVWIDRAEPNRPCKIEFDLSFGTLVASLRSYEAADRNDVVEDWENWGKEK